MIQTEMTTRQVAGLPDVYAPGDAGDFPVKRTPRRVGDRGAYDDVAAAVAGEVAHRRDALAGAIADVGSARTLPPARSPRHAPSRKGG